MNAIKKIALDESKTDAIIKEFNLMLNLNSNYVEVKSSWIEDNYFINEAFEKYLKIGDKHPVLILKIQIYYTFKWSCVTKHLEILYNKLI
jgi:hypothetical protein